MELENVIIHGGTFVSAQGDVQINNKESGMHDFRSVQNDILIDDLMKGFISWDWEFLLERFMIRQNVPQRQIVILTPARPFDRLS